MKSIRTGLTAFLLSFLTPGLGQVYNGQLLKSIFGFGGLLALLLLSTAVGLTHTLSGLIVHIAVFLFGYVLLASEAAFRAIQQVRTGLRPIHTWRSYLVGASLLLIAVFALPGNVPDRIPGVRAYKMTAESMLPTLDSDDRIVADMNYYRSHAPQRGEVIVFVEPTNNVLYIKRISAIGGDVVSLRGHGLQINGTVVSEPYAKYEPGEGRAESGDFGPATIPADRYFTLGDNRDHSYDSRYWGSIARDRILGKALYIYWSKDKSRIGRAIR
jgi:signal peptidase I